MIPVALKCAGSANLGGSKNGNQAGPGLLKGRFARGGDLNASPAQRDIVYQPLKQQVFLKTSRDYLIEKYPVGLSSEF